MTFTETLWHGFRRIDFAFEDRAATLVFPKENGCRRFAMKTEYFDAFPDTEIALLNEGFHLTYIKNRTRWGTDDDCDIRHRFAAFIAKEYRLYPRFVAVGMSCGGYHAVNFAERYPEDVSFLYLDAPLLSMESLTHTWERYPECAENEEKLLPEWNAAYGFSDRSDAAVFARDPIHRLPALIQNGIPVGLVYGDADRTVIPQENAELLLRYYETHGGRIRAWKKEGCDHHPHGLSDPAPLIAYMKEVML